MNSDSPGDSEQATEPISAMVCKTGQDKMEWPVLLLGSLFCDPQGRAGSHMVAISQVLKLRHRAGMRHPCVG